MQNTYTTWSHIVKKFIFALIAGSVVSTCAAAGEVNPNGPASSWQQSNNTERSNYAAMASIMCQSPKCDGRQIKACMDETTRPPVPPGLSSMSIGELAINCIKIMKAQQ